MKLDPMNPEPPVMKMDDGDLAVIVISWYYLKQITIYTLLSG
jgi:hypothetical protein